MNTAAVRKMVQILATWFGCGRSPILPGTVGTLGALPLVWAVAQGQAGRVPFVAALAFAVFAIVIAHFYERLWATRHDSAELVIDEVAGFLLTMTGLPFELPLIAVGFLLFRILDMAKPFPISYVDQKVPGGFGAVADDLVAGAFANVALRWLLHNGVLG